MTAKSTALFVSVLLLAACFPQRPPVVRAPIPMPQEVRALWVVRDVLTHPESIKVMVARAHEAGFNTLIVQVRGRGDAYYSARWEPRAAGIVDQPNFDPLALVLKEAHARNIAVHAWLNTALLADMDKLPADTTHIYHRRPDLLAVPYSVARELYAMDPRSPRYRARILDAARLERNQVEGVYTSPAAPETKEHIYSMWMDVLEHYDVDGLNFDYVRYPARSHDYSRVSLDRFRRWLLPQLTDADRARFAALEGDPLVYADSFPSRYGDFRRAQITELVERIYFGVKKRNPNVIVSADVFANARDAYENRFQDWTDWLRRGFLDVAALMAYNTSTDLVRDQVRVAIDAGGAARVWAGLGAHRMEADSVIVKINAARALGARGIVLFSYGATIRPGPLNPNGDYLQRVQRAAWPDRR